eukprot:2332960-Amphidinium_carterae.5
MLGAAEPPEGKDMTCNPMELGILVREARFHPMDNNDPWSHSFFLTDLQVTASSFGKTRG